ncbi:MAG: hypothetical protein ABEJ57_06785 [Halobacteriaceae archaeon]
MSNDLERSVLRTSARAVVLGFWTTLLGLLVVYLGVRAGALLASTSSSTGMVGALGLTAAFRESLLAVYSGGTIAIAVGLFLIGVGLRFLGTAR